MFPLLMPILGSLSITVISLVESSELMGSLSRPKPILTVAPLSRLGWPPQEAHEVFDEMIKKFHQSKKKRKLVIPILLTKQTNKTRKYSKKKKEN